MPPFLLILCGVWCVCVPAPVFHYIFAEVREQIREVVSLPPPVGLKDGSQNFRNGGRKGPLPGNHTAIVMMFAPEGS